MGRTNGGLNTKIHALVNVRSQALVIALSAGNDTDISLAEEPTERLPCHFEMDSMSFLAVTEKRERKLLIHPRRIRQI
jgi:hypothetical protein